MEMAPKPLIPVTDVQLHSLEAETCIDHSAKWLLFIRLARRERANHNQRIAKQLFTSASVFNVDFVQFFIETLLEEEKKRKPKIQHECSIELRRKYRGGMQYIECGGSEISDVR